MLNIKQIVDKVYLASDKNFSRYHSLTHCYSFFQKYFVGKDDISEEYYDLAALNLAFYLASWGMYRGSTFLLQYDYKIFIDLLKTLKRKGYNFDAYDLYETSPQLIVECFNTIKDYFQDVLIKLPPDNKNRGITTTLITKILLGVYGISPAFDRFFLDGLKIFNTQHLDKKFKISRFYDLEKFSSAYEQVLNFYEQNKECIDSYIESKYVEKSTFKLPIMRVIDMYFWQLGYLEQQKQ